MGGGSLRVDVYRHLNETKFYICSTTDRFKVIPVATKCAHSVNNTD